MSDEFDLDADMDSLLSCSSNATDQVSGKPGQAPTYRLRPQYRVEMLDDGERESSPDIVSGEPCQQDLLR
ncbi:hypothetical protein HQ325_01175 [Rhodococcus sp. BP-349]|uniref:hypothetical protein n=1 Tax=unclassified Rhodococcus (in: high G+C Gram-positive bacteria) TaxID=192944 RepID=UPI001C9B5FD3|nr:MULTISPECIES: hypothetical protein [unclassified Rhodococcus (in: high G+C Gram-positive bacteria)]MBY6537272.1 hypothetical protein [Rhodococcus sp. BP-363]MBY6541609.1 hypothetical protein [Rhodococcus sp. BP-369]MBY6560839.1 hypothetical protein [Rhodococcus sp. BP-370]MBY6575131.1 hypothetical protein [Rhodococcus sp. BP-364]MBY6584432.1 hypothetical protein [Rhodococcus sp. BP-358]